MRPGDVVAGRFEIEAIAGQGGMGEVFRAFDRHTQGAVALKVLRARAAADADRFVREGQLLAEISHPGVVRYVAHGRTPSGNPYLAMEWLEGHDLDAHLAAGKLALGDAITLSARVAEALGAAHARGVVHRDVKPSNIFLVDGRIDRIRVLDFGIAQHGQDGTRMTQTGLLLGTPAYMAPEQARAARDLDARADVFALGAVLFECLTGRAPFVADHLVALLAKIVYEEPPRVGELEPAVPASIEALVARFLSKDKAARPRDGGEAAALIAGVADSAPPPTGAPRSAAAITGGEQQLLAVLMTVPVGLAWLPSATAALPDGAGAGTQILADAPDVSAGGEVLEAIRASAGARGGKIKLLADGSLLVALTGTGSAGDLAAGAARCALDLRALLPGTPIALVMGRAVVTARVPVGEALDRAASLLRGPAAGLSGVHLDEVTAGLLDERFEIHRHDGGDHALLCGERESEGAARTLLGRPTPCVGRERELGILAAVTDECFAEPIARAVVVTAAVGVGKSRLRHELAARLRSRSEPVALWSGRGDPITSGSPFGLIAPAVRRAAGILEGEAPAARRQKLAARVAQRVPAADAPRVTQFLGELTGVPFPEGQSVLLRSARQDPMLMSDQIRRAFVDLLRAEAAAAPVVFLLEDAHWADGPSVKLLDAALRELADRPLLVVAFARPEVHDLFPRLWAERGALEVRLAELGRRAADKLVRHALPGVDDATAARLVDRSGGNAFTLEELIRAVAEGKGDSLPGTVLAVAQARLEGFDPGARRVLRAASVLGDVFWEGAVAKLLGAPAGDPNLSAWLAELTEREVLIGRGEGEFAGQIEHAFRQGLVREAAYASLTDADRALAHRLAGEWLEAAGESVALMLAEHFERGGAPGRAAPWFLRAAEQALDAGDLDAAVARAARGAAACAADTPGASVSMGDRGPPAETEELLGRLLALQAEASWWRGAYDATDRAGVEALRRLPPGSPAWCGTAGHLCEVSYRTGDLARLRQMIDALVAIVPSDDNRVTLALTMARVAVPLLIGGLYAHAESLILRIGVAGAEHERFPATAAAIETAQGFWATFRSLDHELGRERFAAAAASFTRAGDARGAARAAALSACVQVQLGVYAEAEAFFRAAIASSERAGLPYLTSLCQSYLGSALSRRGALDEALSMGTLAVEACRARHDRLMGVPALCHRSYTRTLAGDHAGAEQDARAALGLAAGSPRLHARAAGTLAHVLLEARAGGDVLGLATEGKRALDALGGIGEGDALVELSYARALAGAGRGPEAAEALRGARDRLLAAAGRIRSEAARATFLSAVAENAAILSLSRRWLGG